MSEEHGQSNYVKIWAILVALLLVSVLGPMLGIKAVTLITAFGIAVVKAYLVGKHFMHLGLEPRFVSYMVATVLVFMLLFFAGTAPDVMQHEGSGWAKPDWQAASVAYEARGGAGHGDGH
jgi:caa(3)-type oxidase subunit IV